MTTTATKKPAVKKTAKKSEVPAAEVAAIETINEVTPAETPAPVVESDVIPADGLPAPVDNPVTFEPVVEAVPVTIPEPAPALNSGNISGEILTLTLDQVFPDQDQPRKNFDIAELRETGASIREKGQLIPIRVILAGDKYKIEDGERRFRACQMAGIKTIQAVLVEEVSDEERLCRQMSANTGKPLLPMETANGYMRLSLAGWGTDKIAKSFGVSQETVKLDLKMCSLVAVVQDAVDRGFSKSVARRISELDPAKQIGAFTRAEKCPNSVKQLKAVEAFLNQKNNDTVLSGISEDTEDEKSKARKAWGSLKSGFCAFKNTPFSNGKGLTLVGAMKSQAHRIELEATAKEMIKAAQKILADLDSFQAAIDQNKPIAKAA